MRRGRTTPQFEIDARFHTGSADGCLWDWYRKAAGRRYAQLIRRLFSANNWNRRSRPILLKNSKMRPLHFLAKLNRGRQFAV
jgi:hypothetical protein